MSARTLKSRAGRVYFYSCASLCAAAWVTLFFSVHEKPAITAALFLIPMLSTGFLPLTKTLRPSLGWFSLSLAAALLLNFAMITADPSKDAMIGLIYLFGPPVFALFTFIAGLLGALIGCAIPNSLAVATANHTRQALSWFANR